MATPATVESVVRNRQGFAHVKSQAVDGLVAARGVKIAANPENA
jgi:hypothetical protein